MHRCGVKLQPKSLMSSLMMHQYLNIVSETNLWQSDEVLDPSLIPQSLSSPSLFRASRRPSPFSERGQISTLMPCDRGSF